MDFIGRHPSTVQACRGLAYAHLPAPLQEVSKPFYELAVRMLAQLPDDPELIAAIRKIREAKDCCVLLAAQPHQPPDTQG